MPAVANPIFHRRVDNLDELQTALLDAAYQCGTPPRELPFPARVRVDLIDGQVLLSILKRN